MKKLFCYLLLFVLALCSCTQKERVFRVGISQIGDDAWRKQMNNEITLEASLYHNFDLEFCDANNGEEQKEIIERFIKEKLDLLIISPVDAETLTPTITKAYHAGIPVILVDRIGTNSQYSAFIGGDNRHIGREAVNYISYSLPAQGGNLLLIRGRKGSPVDSERYEGVLEALPDNIKIVGEYYCNFNETEARSKMLSILEYGDIPEEIDAIFAFNDIMAFGVNSAYSEYRSLTESDIKTPIIVGVDAQSGISGGQQAIIDGRITASFVYHTRGDEIINLARKILLGIPYEKNNYTTTSIIDASNVGILTLQGNQLFEQQVKLQDLNSVIDNNTHALEVQRRMMTFLIILVTICVILALTFVTLYRQKSLLSSKLTTQNQTISRQVEELESQKKQLIDISAKLEETTQAKLSFFTNISHEFKTPLSLINGPVNDILASNNLNMAEREKLQIVHRNTSKLERLIGELLDFRSYENSKMVVSYSMGDLSVFVKNIIAMFEDIIKRRNLNFVYDDGGKNYFLPFDPKNFEKLFTNLLSNAFNHVDKEGTIKIVLNRTKTNIVLSVFNSGSFIPEEQREKIFQNFYTLDINQKGTGIGLALVCAIVDSFDGKIDLKSEEGIGTTFIVSLPLANNIVTDYVLEEDYIPSFARQKHNTMNDGIEAEEDFIHSDTLRNKPVVLVIEDNIDMRSYIKSILSADYNVIMSSDGEAGIAKAIQYRPSVIISDVLMPKKDGYEVCETLKNNKATDYIPIILLTACSFEDQKVRGYEVGADAYIQKPFSVNVLKTRIAKLLEKSRAVSAAIKGDWLIGYNPDRSNDLYASLLERIREYVEEHINEEISVDALSEKLGMSRSKLYRELKSVTQYSPIDLANMIKLKKAIDLMIYKKFNISQAAVLSGFSSQSYFSRTFQKYYHETPSDYIKRKTK